MSRAPAWELIGSELRVVVDGGEPGDAPARWGLGEPAADHALDSGGDHAFDSGGDEAFDAGAADWLGTAATASC